MGFGSIAHEIFLEVRPQATKLYHSPGLAHPNVCRTLSRFRYSQLDQDESGAVSYGELTALLKERTSSVGKDCKRFLTALSFERAAGDGAGQELDTTSWILKPSTKEELREMIQARLLEVSARVSDFFDALTGGGKEELTRTSFVTSFVRVGYDGEPEMLQELFDQIDMDDSGSLGIDEICEDTHKAPLQPSDRHETHLTINVFAACEQMHG